MNIQTRTVARGVQSVRLQPRAQTPAETLDVLTDTVQNFIARNDKAIDDINARLAANMIGGGGGGDADMPSAGELRRAQAGLGEYVRSGSLEGSVRASMTTRSGPEGGFVVQPELEKQITRFQRDLSPMRRLARVVKTNSGEYKIPMAASGVESGWAGEEEGRPETDGFKLLLKAYPVHEVYANPAVTQTLLDDAIEDIGAYLAEEIGQAFTEKEGAAFVNGDGIKKPRGFLTYPTSTDADATRATGTLQFHQTAGSGAVAADDLIDLLYMLRAGYRAGSTWLMNSKTAGAVRKLKDADGNHIWSVATMPGELPMLLGYPVETDESMPDVGAGAFPIAFGNFQRGYLIVDRFGVRLLRDALTNKPFVHFYTTKRVGGGLWQSNAIKLLKIKA